MKIGAEVYSVRYPSHREAKDIQDELEELQKNDGDIVGYIEERLKKLDLDEKFFELDEVTSQDIFETWTEVNSIKK